MMYQITAPRTVFDPTDQIVDDLRRELHAEHAQLLRRLRQARAGLGPTAGGEARAMQDLRLALEIVIAIAEREAFLDMPAARIPVVLRQLGTRVRRLARMIEGEDGVPETVARLVAQAAAVI